MTGVVPGRVSVIVAANNGAAVLPRCLDALYAQEHPDVEVIVVDDGSRDDTAGVAARWLDGRRLTVVRTRLGRGASAARNVGMSYASGEILAFLDCDGYAAPDWALELARAFEDPTVGAVVSVVFLDRDPLILNGAGGTMNRSGWAGDSAFGHPYSMAELPREVLYGMSCGMGVRRQTAEAVGRFDERMRVYYEDVDYGIRVWRAGWRVVVAGRAWVDHGLGQSLGDTTYRELLCERHRMRVVLKHWPARRLPRWMLQETRSVRHSLSPARDIKLAAMRWNLRGGAGLMRARWRLRHAPRPPDHLFDSRSCGWVCQLSPIPVNSPEPARTSSTVEVTDPGHHAALMYGWHAIETDSLGPYRWSARHAALYLRVPRRSKAIELIYRLPPWPIGDVAIELYSTDGHEVAWVLRPPATSAEWRHERHDADVPAGEFVLVFSVSRTRPHLPSEGRAIGVALRKVSVE